jgi:hypothetical protein
MKARPAALVALAALTCLTACGTAPAGHNGHKPRSGSPCATTVHGVVNGPGSFVATWLPSGFHLQTGTQSASALPQTTYVKVSPHPGAPRIMLGSANQRGPLTAAAGGRATGVPVLIQGHHGLLESGPPSPQFIGVYWKPSAGYLVSVVGYKVPASIVLRVAKAASFDAPGIVSLPVTPGQIVTRQAAIAAVERATGVRARHATAKLSSWTEIESLAGRVQRVPNTPRLLTASPWRPVWAVRLGRPQAKSSLVVVDAASGRAELNMPVHGRWFSALTDRDLTDARLCPGGSTALVPFGVLTRDEQAYISNPPATGHSRTSVRLLLSTVPAVNKADSGLYGGCVQQNCSIDQLVWVTIVTVRAEPGKTIGCLPGGVSVPPGYKPKQVKQYYEVEVPNNLGVSCGKPPGSIMALNDLAPPAPSRGGGR